MDDEVQIELTTEQKSLLRQEQERMLKLIDALTKLDKSKEWHVLKELVFDKSLIAIERQMLNESVAQKIDVNKIYRLQGEWAWAKQYSDVNRFVETLKKQLADIKNKLS